MKQKIRVGILFGGKSAEHEVSIQSAKNVVRALNKDIFEPVLIGIDKQGVWHLSNEAALLSAGEGVGLTKLELASSELTLAPGNEKGELISSNAETAANLDVVFPILHGPMGEDGTVQGFLELANIPYVGPGVLGSAVCMDKDVAKRLLRDAGIPIAPFITVRATDRTSLNLDEIVKALGLPLFVKPANMGSSVGVNKATTTEELLTALNTAFEYDNKVLVESAIVGDEVECSVLGNDNARTSIPGRVLPQAEFYSYDAKYIDDEGAALEIPAKLPEDIIKKVQDTALNTYKVLNCEGMSRVDVFVTKDGEVLVNEVNTIPGFTQISMYPKMWEASGLSYTDLITELINLAIARHESRRKLRSSV